jgi:hypothetical protein
MMMLLLILRGIKCDVWQDAAAAVCDGAAACLALPADSCAYHGCLSAGVLSQQHRQWMFTLVMQMIR